MEDGFSFFTRKPTLAIVDHHSHEWVYSSSLTHVSFLTLAVWAIPTLSVENWNNMVPFFYVHYAFTYALNNPATKDYCVQKSWSSCTCPKVDWMQTQITCFDRYYDKLSLIIKTLSC